MRTRYNEFAIAGLLALAAAVTSDAAQAQDFPGCTLPFDSIKESHSIDSSCGPEGKTTSDANRLQNIAKNNFCAAGKPVTVTFNTFLKLQQAAEEQGIPFGGQNLPDDRSGLKGIYTSSSGNKIGEGSVVRFVAFVVDAHHSNVSNGESVNCKLRGKEDNDIHIMLGASPSTAACSTVTAEMSPHFRPGAWDQIAEINLPYPVRITGQLFFDASHKPCKGGKGPNPKRSSLWEIHPVYAVDVCSSTTLTGCGASDESAWTPLGQWLASGEEGMSELRLPSVTKATCSWRGEPVNVKSKESGTDRRSK